MNIAEAIVGINAQLGKQIRVFREYRGKKDRNGMTKHDGVGYFHHGCFEVQRQQDARFFGSVDFTGKEITQSLTAHDGCIDYFACQQGSAGFQDTRFAIVADQFDADIACSLA